MVSDAHRRRLAALEEKATPAAKPDPSRVPEETAVARILKIAHAWAAEAPGRSCLNPTPDLYERLTPEDQEMLRFIVEERGTY